MQTVIETPAYLRSADDAGLTDDERADIVSLLANNPDAGDVIKETGGCRKVRVAGRGKGKSGGYRVITYYASDTVPVFLLTVFSKGERADLNGRERRELAKLTATLVRSLSAKVKPIGKRQ